MILDILKLYWGDILIVFILLFVVLYLYKHKKYEELKGIGLYLVIQAEKALGSKTGSAKFSMVLDSLYSKLPNILKFLFTQEELTQIIEDSVDDLKGLLSTGADLKSYDSEIFWNGGF